MISVHQAKELVLRNCNKKQVVTIKLEDSNGLVLAEDIYSNQDIPPFDQSAMDGYAFRFEDLKHNEPLYIDGEIPAGSAIKELDEANKAMRIFTGAPVPINADVVVMQEKVTVKDQQIFIDDQQLNVGTNIRRKGSQTKKGELALNAGTKLNAAAIGFLASLGFAEVKVYKSPGIFLIVTGKELQKPGNSLETGQIYESNSFSLTAALSQMGIHSIRKNIADDDVIQIGRFINHGITSSDMILLTGGVSVGDYDFVTKAAENAGVKMIFHKVKQKPGKPLYFGMANDIPVFGLPGNPASVLTCFYEYVAPAIRKMMGLNSEGNSNQLQLQLANYFQKKQGLTYFLKGKISGNEVTLLHSQESYQMGSFTMADCLVVLDEDKTDFQKADLVEVHLI